MSQIHQEMTFEATPGRVYRALTDSREFATFTGVDAEISAEEGGEFLCFGTFVLGRNVQLVTDTLIVQAWRVFNWPEGVYSIVRIGLSAEGGQTKLVLDQDGVPDDAVKHVDGGWEHKYWAPLRKYLES